MRVVQLRTSQPYPPSVNRRWSYAHATTVAIVRGLDSSWFRESSMSEIVRPAQEDLFR